MAEALVFPDAEALAVSWLAPKVGVRVATKIPNPRPETFIRVVRVGGTIRDLIIDSPMLVFECWAPDEIAASSLARVARAHVFSMAQEIVSGSWVYAVRDIAGPQSFPDPVTDTPRYQFTVQIDTRGMPLP